MDGMRVYLYHTWGVMENPEGFATLKRAMLHDVSDHMYLLGGQSFLFLTRKGYEVVSIAIRERQDRPFLLVDITDGINRENFKTNVNLDEVLKHLADGPLSTNSILDKICRHGYASLTRDERDYLDSKSNEATSS